MVDTRSGRWLLIIIGLATVALKGFFSAALTGTPILLPVMGILSVTGEWSQRTVLTTFTLVPERPRILVAKLAGGSLLGAVFIAIALVTALAGRAIAAALDRSSGSWSLPPSAVATTLLFAVIAVFTGVAYGLLFMNSPLAIVMYFLLPMAWTTLSETVKALRGPAGWLDTNRTLNPLLEEGVTAEEWARAGTSLAVWLLIPLLAGLIRLTRREVK
jgi:ABC-type transport system involved in multi-copper enzyme maturation permease subunit